MKTPTPFAGMGSANKYPWTDPQPASANSWGIDWIRKHLGLEGSWKSLLGRRPNGLFSAPLPRLCGSDKRLLFVGTYHAGIASDTCCFQKRLRTFVGGNCLEMAECIAHEINRGALQRQHLGARVGEDYGDCVEQHRRRARQLSVSRQHRSAGKLRTADFGRDDLNGGTRFGCRLPNLLNDNAVGTIRN